MWYWNPNIIYWAVVVMIVWLFDIQLHMHMQSVPIATDVVSMNPPMTRYTRYNINVIKFVGDLRQVGFLWVLRFSSSITLITTILLKVALNALTLTFAIIQFYLDTSESRSFLGTQH